MVIGTFPHKMCRPMYASERLSCNLKPVNCRSSIQTFDMMTMEIDVCIDRWLIVIIRLICSYLHMLWQERNVLRFTIRI